MKQRSIVALIICLGLYCSITVPSISQAHVGTESIPVIAEMEYRIYVDLNPKDIELRNKYGMLLLNRNKISEAESQFTLILSMAPKNFDAMDALGLVRIKQQRYPEAVKLLQDAIVINPKDVAVYLHLGKALEATGQSKPAENAYENGLRLLKPAAGTSTPTGKQTKDEEAALRSALQNLRAKTAVSSQKHKEVTK
ncbi:MAG: hypothetical protein A2511_15145 [Deltaproteobacteria bacterium RIFOXYD12_FULL_50_9]|nr:MAG: hypothetical protein A2511_15145 [Deltaproteobacteria bacterium RIFOXYD12_FULL_50_9]